MEEECEWTMTKMKDHVDRAVKAGARAGESYLLEFHAGISRFPPLSTFVRLFSFSSPIFTNHGSRTHKPTE